MNFQNSQQHSTYDPWPLDCTIEVQV